MNTRKAVLLLLDWFATNARDLPWRRTSDPYAIWVSEIMLQQTQVKTVISFWERWMRQLPTLAALAKADLQTIHKLWEGLGYYTRVRNMHKAAQFIVTKYSGEFPGSFEQVLELPGIGRYTAGAVCSIAFNQPQPILDGNVIRVLTRLFGITGNPSTPAVKARLWDLAERLVKQADLVSKAAEWENFSRDKIVIRKSQIPNASACSHLNQSLMELGALVCIPRQPRCDLCPVARLCCARKENRIEQLPEIPSRPPAIKRRFVAFVVQHSGKFLVRQRPTGVVNAHLWEFPNVEVANDNGDPRRACRQLLGNPLAEPLHLRTIHHTITRYRIRLDVFQVRVKGKTIRSMDHSRWLQPLDLRRLPFSSAHKRILSELRTEAAEGNR